MRRWAFNIAAGISLLICLTTAVFWVTSRGGRLHYLGYGSPDNPHYYALLSANGIVRFAYRAADPYGRRPRSMKFRAFAEEAGEVDLAAVANRGGRQWLGFGYYRLPDPWPRTTGESGFFFPHLFAVLLFAALPVAWGVAKGRERNRKRGMNVCVHCGYDLRASPDRCPECGAERLEIENCKMQSAN